LICFRGGTHRGRDWSRLPSFEPSRSTGTSATPASPLRSSGFARQRRASPPRPSFTIGSSHSGHAPCVKSGSLRSQMKTSSCCHSCLAILVGSCWSERREVRSGASLLERHRSSSAARGWSVAAVLSGKALHRSRQCSARGQRLIQKHPSPDVRPRSRVFLAPLW